MKPNYSRQHFNECQARHVLSRIRQERPAVRKTFWILWKERLIKTWGADVVEKLVSEMDRQRSL